MLKISIIQTLHGFQAILGRKILCTKRTRTLAITAAKLRLHEHGYTVAQVKFV
jgi:hypothetical protein